VLRISFSRSDTARIQLIRSDISVNIYKAFLRGEAFLFSYRLLLSVSLTNNCKYVIIY